MGDTEHTSTTDPADERAGQAHADVPDVEMDPEDHVNRPDQPDFDPAEREQYEHPPVSIADADLPEDR